jgi:hypothetical protein
MKSVMAITTVAPLGAAVFWSPSAHAITGACAQSCLIGEEYTLDSIDATSPGLLGAFKLAKPGDLSSIDLSRPAFSRAQRGDPRRTITRNRGNVGLTQ